MGYVQERRDTAGEHSDRQMSFVNIVKKKDRPGFRVLAIAIAISLACHILWLALIRIVSSPIPKSAVRFSKVAFLGPILAGVTMEVRVSPAHRGMLERRYRKIMGEISYDPGAPREASIVGYESRVINDRTSHGLSAIIDDAVAGKKLEPDSRSVNQRS